MAGPRAVHHLLAVSLLAIALSCSSAPPPVYDTDGHELSTDANYYVIPAARGHGGGLTMAPHVLQCPLFVAQEADELRKGFPVRFTPLQEQQGGGGDRTVRVSTDVRVHFAAVTTCVQTTEWHVPGGGDDPPSRRRHVVTGPVRAPSPGGREKVFHVERHGGAYKLASCRDSCRDLGVFRDETDAWAWLGASDRPHVVVFKKAPPF